MSDGISVRRLNPVTSTLRLLSEAVLLRNKNMKTLYKTLIALTLIAQTADAFAEAWSLDSCVSHAVTRNISVLQQGENQGRRTGNHRSQRQIPPSLEASASQNFNFGRGLTAQNTYADRNTSQFGWNAGMSLPLFEGTRRIPESQGIKTGA